MDRDGDREIQSWREKERHGQTRLTRLVERGEIKIYIYCREKD